MIQRIISGGQTGADQGGLYAGSMLGIETGGWACQGWVTEDGPQRELLRGFGLVECRVAGYAARTEANVRLGDGTVIFYPHLMGQKITGGSYMTECVALALEKPLLIIRLDINRNDEIDRFWTTFCNVQTLNVAGPRESRCVGIGDRVCQWLMEVLG